MGIDVKASISNSYFTINELFFNNTPNKTLKMDFNKMSAILPRSGFASSGVVDSKMFLDVYLQSKYEFGFFTEATGYAFASVPKSLIDFIAKGNKNKGKNISGAFKSSSSVFAGTGFFYGMTIKDFKFRISGTYIIPLFYIPYDSFYSFENDPETGKIKAKSSSVFNVYTTLPVFKKFGGGSPLRGSGFDIDFEGTYKFQPWADLNFSLKHIPIFPASLSKGSRVDLLAGCEIESLFSYLDSILTGKDEPKIKNDSHGFKVNEDVKLKKKYVLRPIKLSVSSDIFPLKNNYLIITPNLGFHLMTPFYVDTGFKLESRFLKVLGVYYSFCREDRVWKNRGGFFVDTRVFKFEMSAASASPSFAGSFKGHGLELSTGILFGY